MLNLDMVRPSGVVLVRQMECTLVSLHDWNNVASKSRRDELLILMEEVFFVHNLHKRHDPDSDDADAVTLCACENQLIALPPSRTAPPEERQLCGHVAWSKSMYYVGIII